MFDTNAGSRAVPAGVSHPVGCDLPSDSELYFENCCNSEFQTKEGQSHLPSDFQNEFLRSLGVVCGVEKGPDEQNLGGLKLVT